MTHRENLYRQLDALEPQLLEDLVPLLRRAAAGNESLLFHVERYHPLPMRLWLSPAMEDLLDLADRIIALRRKLGEPVENSVADRLHHYCKAYNDVSNSHRRTAKNLAATFLTELREASGGQ